MSNLNWGSEPQATSKMLSAKPTLSERIPFDIWRIIGWSYSVFLIIIVIICLALFADGEMVDVNVREEVTTTSETNTVFLPAQTTTIMMPDGSVQQVEMPAITSSPLDFNIQQPNYQWRMNHPGLFAFFILFGIAASIVYTAIDMKVFICHECHHWLHSPMIRRRNWLFYIGKCHNCDSDIATMAHQAKLARQNNVA